jgi:4'-phosphopantetheinyl transferase EntD
VIGAVLPGTVVAEESFGDAPGGLLPEEEDVVRRAVERRRREFTTVRVCARRALARLGIAPVPILPGRRGEPRWPEGVVGSMTHCDGYRAAAVAPVAVAAGIGIDAEPHAPLPAGVLGTIARDEERRHLAGLARAAPAVHHDRLLFSTKESVFKAWYPLTGRELDFDEASITLDPTGGTFHARLLPRAHHDPGPSSFAGRWVVAAGIVLTAVVVPADPAHEAHETGPTHPARRDP